MTRADTPEGSLKKLSELFTSLEETQRMGTLKLSSSNNQMVYVYFNSGFIEYIKTNRHKTLLGRALVKRRKLSETQLKAALHRQNEAPKPVRLGQILVDGGLVTKDDIQKALAFQMAEEIFACFRWEQFTDVFYRGEPPLDIFQEEDREFRVALRPAQLAQEAERRARELRTVRKLIPSDHDVCVITTDSQLLGDGSGERELIGFIDGRRDVEEYLEALPAPDFLGLRILSKLLSNGHAARLDGDQLVKLGQECEEASDYNRAKKRYLRASEIGHSDFELSRRIGQIEEVLGHGKEAVSRYRAYAEQCERHEFYEVATETLRHCLTLDSDQTEALKSLAILLEKQELNNEAVAVYEDLLKQSEGKIDSSELLQIWSEIGRLKPEDCSIRRTLADLYLEAEDRTQAFMELQELATLYLTDNKLDEAIPVLREAHELDKDEIMVHESLATTLARLGRADEAITEFLALARNLERADDGGIFRQHLITIYNKIIDLSPDHGEARAWLAKAYEDKKESDKAAANYKGMLPALRAGDDDEKLLEVLGKVYSLEPSDEEIAHEYADLLAEHNQSVEGIRILSKIAEAALTEGDQDKAADVYSGLLDLAPGHFIAHRTLARSEVAAGDKDQALKRYRGMAILFEANGHLEDAEESWRKALDIRANDPQIHASYADCLTFCNKPKTAVKHWFKAAKLYRDEENKGLAKSCISHLLDLDSGHEDAKKLLKSLESKPAPSATIEMDKPAVPEKPQPKEKAMPTITGGGRASVQVLGGTRRLSSVNKLKSMLFSKGFAASGPEGPGDVASEQVSNKAKSGINKLKALRGGGASDSGSAQNKAISEGPEGDYKPLDEKVSKKAKGGINKLKAMRGGGSNAGPKKAISEGPEGEYKPLDEKVSKKAKGGINKLKALRGGGGSAGGAGPKKAISEGPEGDYKPLDEKVSKKAKGGINKLKALRGGGGSAGGAKPKGAVSEGPEGDYKPVDVAVSNKAKSGINKLKALRGGGSVGGAGPKKAVSEGPEGDYKPLDEKVSQKAKSGINKLKALKGTGQGPLSGGPEQPFKPVSEGASNKAKSGINKLKAMRGGASSGGISAGPEGDYKPVDDKVSKKAKGGINKLKALRSGGGSAGGAKPKGAVSEGPEGDYKPLDSKVSNKAKSGINKLKALRGGGGFGGGAVSGGGAKPKGAVSEGPEGDYKPVDAAVSSKAKSGINKLKALRGGGGAAGGAKPKGAVSEGPEGDYKPVDAAVSNKAKSGINKLKALRGGGGKKSGDGPKPKGAISEGPEGDYKPVDEKVSQKAKSGINKLKALKKGSFQQSET